MLREIETRTKISYKDMCETFKKICKKYGFKVDLLQNASTKYARVQLIPESNGFDTKNQCFKYVFKTDCSISLMGSLTIDEMNQASEDIKAATAIAQYMMDKLDGKVVIVTAG